ncbi:MAG: DUF697 domain-containing protein [Synechococcales cyanobacterium]
MAMVTPAVLTDQAVLSLLKQAETWAGSRPPLTTLRRKVEQHRFHIAVFGLVNRGKSALINALLGSPHQVTGPLNGVTQNPAAVPWKLARLPLRVELVDTPGLQEVGGTAREQLAWSAARRADLILFVIAGDMTQLEYQALLELRSLSKPLLLVFNKIDLYPTCDRELIYAQLTSPTLRQWVSPDDILLVAAAPPPQRVRYHWLDGRITDTWEYPPPDIAPLRRRLHQILRQEGPDLIRTTVLWRLHQWHESRLRQLPPPTVLWPWITAKSVLWLLLPGLVLDGLSGLVVDLAWIRWYGQTTRLPFTLKLWGSLVPLLGVNLAMALGLTLLSWLTHGLVWGSGPWNGHWGDPFNLLGDLLTVAGAGWTSRRLGQRGVAHWQAQGIWTEHSPRHLLQQFFQSCSPTSWLHRVQEHHV